MIETEIKRTLIKSELNLIILRQFSGPLVCKLSKFLRRQVFHVI